MSNFLATALNNLDYAEEPNEAPAEPIAEKKVEPMDASFKTKLRLSIPESYTMGVIHMTDLMKDFKLDSFTQKKDGALSVDDYQLWDGTGSYRNEKSTSREFKSRPSTVDSDIYFMLIESSVDNSAIVVPVSEYYTMEPIIAPKATKEIVEHKEKDLVAERLKAVTKFEDSSTDTIVSSDKREYSTNRTATRLSWDYEDAASDDDELYTNASAMDQGNQESDPFNLSQQKLSLYGHVS
ncbi:hypothetical protein BdWA1_002912 [Babesia duncani]|uniref:Uncharacterized protein n=1 Tax=Babesia duncani TaxID=323732 RepID=A0AAD9PI16_9APIC|nr:hypothetical protein BdWA1_003937 [Babesia duncani]KAK2195239.1 hypothetical protein BdWA1_002912 [Babesia duncani]